MREDREAALAPCGLQQIERRPSCAEERHVLAPDRDMHEAVCILVLHPGDDEDAIRTYLCAGLPVGVPPRVVEAAIVLRGEKQVIASPLERLGERCQRPGCVVRPLGVDVSRGADRPHRAPLAARRAKNRMKLQVSASKTSGSERLQLYRRSRPERRVISRSVGQNFGHVVNALDCGPRRTNARCAISMPRCRQTIAGGSSGTSGTKSGSSASCTAHAGYSKPRRRARAMLPHGRPFNSMSHARPSPSRRNSSMKRPVQPLAARNRSVGAISSSSTGYEAQAEDAEPCGFSIRIRRCALQPTTPRFVTTPNSPSPVPWSNGWTRRGGCQSLWARRASSASFETTLPVGRTSRPSTSYS